MPIQEATINISPALLVVLMFSSIVGIGVANILMTFAGHVSALSTLAGRHLGATWLVILLLTYLGMFWNSTLLVQRDDWAYTLFLFVIFGPILLLFASSLMTGLMAADGKSSTLAEDKAPLTRFFLLYAAVHAWFIGMDFVLGIAWVAATTVSAILCVSSIGLALVDKQAHVWTFTMAVLVLSAVDVFLT